MAEALNLQEMRKRIGATTLSCKGGVWTARRQFFYPAGRTADSFAEDIQRAFPGAEILDKGQVWKAFNGGAPVSRQSHWLVKFKLGSEAKKRKGK